MRYWVCFCAREGCSAELYHAEPAKGCFVPIFMAVVTSLDPRSRFHTGRNRQYDTIKIFVQIPDGDVYFEQFSSNMACSALAGFYK